MKSEQTFREKIVIITGITRGIGKACALQFGKLGAIVIGIYVSNDQAANELKEEMSDLNGRIHLYKGSVSNEKFIASIFDEVYHTFGSIDLLINNAGKTNDEMALFMTEDKWNDVIQVNFAGAYHCMEAVTPFMLKGGGGSIVNIVSVSGLFGREAQTNYATSKGMVTGLTKLFARKYSAAGIHVYAIAPGMIQTDMVATVPDQKVEEFLQHTQAKRLGTPEEIAHAVCFLSKPSSSYLTGQVIKIDGGFLR